jgi:hypothetical protein
MMGERIAPGIGELRRRLVIATMLASAFAGHCSVPMRHEIAPIGKPFAQTKVLLVG